MSVGNFSVVMVSTYFLFFEAEWIDWTFRFLDRRPAREDPAVALPLAKAPGRWGRWFEDLVGRRAATTLRVLPLPLLMLACMATSLPETTTIPSIVLAGRVITPAVDLSPSRMWPPIRQTIEEMELWQQWNMFAPKPLDHDVYVMGRGMLADGTHVDVLRGERGNGGPIAPPVQRGVFYSRWTKYLLNVAHAPKDSSQVREFARYICRQWNDGAPPGRPALKSLELFREERSVPLSDDRPAEDWHEQQFLDHRCF
jgi:hypothetical protein